MHQHLHGYSKSSQLLHSVLHTDGGSSVAERTVKLDFAALLNTFSTCHPITVRVFNKEPATKFEDLLIVILPFQANDVVFDIATGAFEGKRFQRH